MQGFTQNNGPEAREKQKNHQNLCDSSQSHQTEYPAIYNNLMDLEDQNQYVIPGAWEMPEYFWMFTMRKPGTLESRRGGKLQDTWATTLNFKSKAGSVPWQDKIIV